MNNHTGRFGKQAVRQSMPTILFKGLQGHSWRMGKVGSLAPGISHTEVRAGTLKAKSSTPKLMQGESSQLTGKHCRQFDADRHSHQRCGGMY